MGRDIAVLRNAVDGTGQLDTFPYQQARQLFTRILPDGIAGGGRVLFYGDGPLASLPLSMLLTDDFDGDLSHAPWLIRQASVQVIGNLELFGRLDDQAEGARPTRMAGIGGASLPSRAGDASAQQTLFRSGRPSLRSVADLPPLPGAEQELLAISSALPGDDDLLLIGPDAAEERFKTADLSRANIIAFATHGLVAGELRDLWEPALLLGTNSAESGEDGLLGASEIARLRLNADWVILSACNTSAGDGFGSPIYSGLAAAFSQAGARSLMLSHWRVRDDAAAFLSVRTVNEAATGIGRAHALQNAQLALLAKSDVPDSGHPSIWAPFVIIEN